MAKPRQRCANKRCNEVLTVEQVKRGAQWCSILCVRADGRHIKFNSVPASFAGWRYKRKRGVK